LTATILDGNKIRDEIQSELLQQIADLKRVGVTPGLAAVLVGENPASQIYVRSKVKPAKRWASTARKSSGQKTRPLRNC
jgi:methylenetetrahydrofolate dehydrogenase (NADP+)/methenyltetrahydrofolate cyclohydrolase